MDIEFIATNRIVEDPEQPRKHHNEESLQGLADSIRQHGMLQPITVTPLHNVNMFRIVTGERRWRAAQMIGLTEVPCIIKEIQTEEVLTEQLIENLQREDLQPLEKAKALQSVKELQQSTNRELSKRLGLSERSVGYLLDLLALPEDIGQQVVDSANRPADGQITQKHARALKQLNEQPELQAAVAGRIREGLNSDHTEKMVKALKKRPDRADEILSSPADHLAEFFRDSDEPLAVVRGSGPASSVAHHAAMVLDFVPKLDAMPIHSLPPDALSQLEDALASLSYAAEAALSACRERMAAKA